MTAELNHMIVAAGDNCTSARFLVNHHHGGRGVYFDDPPDHHYFELITVPYGPVPEIEPPAKAW